MEQAATGTTNSTPADPDPRFRSCGSPAHAHCAFVESTGDYPPQSQFGSLARQRGDARQGNFHTAAPPKSAGAARTKEPRSAPHPNFQSRMRAALDRTAIAKKQEAAPAPEHTSVPRRLPGAGRRSPRLLPTWSSGMTPVGCRVPAGVLFGAAGPRTREAKARDLAAASGALTRN